MDQKPAPAAAPAPDFSPVLTEVRNIAAQMKKLERPNAPTDAATNAPVLNAPVLAELKSLGEQLKRLEASVDQKPAATPAPAPAPDFSPVLTEVRNITAQMKKLERPAAPTETAINAPVLAELKALGEQFRKLERTAQQAADTPRDDPKLREEVGRLRQLAVSAGEQLNSCQTKLASLDARPFQQSSSVPRSQPPAEDVQTVAKTTQPSPDGGTVVLYDSFYLKKDQNKSFDDLDLKVALQGVSSRSARVDVNNQTVSIAFGERKEIVYNNMTCELNLTETDLNASQARFNIACKK